MTQENKYAIEIENLTKLYSNKIRGEKKALDNLSIKIPTGSFFALLGSNGAGKSTLINIISTCLEKTSGKITILGKDFDSNLNYVRNTVGVVPQEVFLDPFFTVEELIDQCGGYYGIKKKDRRTEELMKAMGLYEHRNKKTRMLSGGMKRRLLICKALVHDPDILFLDEPTAGVDIDLRNKIWNYISELHKRGKTIILTTHYLEEAQKLCDYIAFIGEGKILKCDKKENIMNECKDRNILVTLSEDNIAKNISIPYKFTLEKRNMSIQYDPTKDSIHEVVSHLVEQKVLFDSISSNNVNLEEIFQKVTGNA